MVYCQLDNGFRFVYTPVYLFKRIILGVQLIHTHVRGYKEWLGKRVFLNIYIDYRTIFCRCKQ